MVSARDTRRLRSARALVALREPLDRQLSPLGLRALAALAPRPGEVVVDIGCGTGQTVRQLAERVGRSGRVIGVDIAPEVLAAARALSGASPNVDYIVADAETLNLTDLQADALYSRFGVMGFADQAAAFANLHRLVRPGGRLAFVCWRSLAENELDLLPLRAAGLERLVDQTPFSFEASDHIRRTLGDAGFDGIEVVADDQAVVCGDLEATLAVVLRVGALGRILRERPELRAEAEPKVRQALLARGTPDHIALGAATWVVTARRP